MSEGNNNPGTENLQADAAPQMDTAGGAEWSETAEAIEPQELTPEALNELKNRASKADENWEKYVRAVADFDNYKKRAARERTEAVRYANEALMEKLLPVLDNFEAALAAANNVAGGEGVDSLRQGVSMIQSQLKSVLNEAGLEEIDALNKTFDPNFHEAVSQQERDDEPEGQVVQQLRKGYKLRDRLVRAAMVVVSKKP